MSSRAVTVRVLALALPLVWCAVAERLGTAVTSAVSALVLVTVVVAVSAAGDRIAGVLAALSGGAWFDFFLAPPVRTFAIHDAADVEIALLLAVVGLVVIEVALWGRRQQQASGTRAGYLDGVTGTARIAAGGMTRDELVSHVSRSLTDLLDVDACRFEAAGPPTAHAVLEPDGSVTVGGHATDVDRDGLPTMEETVLPVRHHGVVQGRFLIVASTRIARPSLEERQVAVLLATLVGSDLASRSSTPGRQPA